MTKGNCLQLYRTITTCLLGYAGLFHFDEIASLKESDISMCDDHMEVFVESSKADRFREGPWVPIARTRSKACPVPIGFAQFLHVAQCNVQN